MRKLTVFSTMKVKAAVKTQGTRFPMHGLLYKPLFGEQATRLLSGAGATGITMRIVFAKQTLAYTRGA